MSVLVIIGKLSRAATTSSSTTTTTTTSASTVDVYIMAGQSNSQGYGARADYFPPYDPSNISSKEKMWNSTTGTFDTLTFTTSVSTSNTEGGGQYGAPTAGAELSLLRKAADASGSKNVYLVKHAVGATPLMEGGGNDWNPLSSGELLDELKDQVLDAKAVLEGEGKTVNFRGFIWQQGESDSWNGVETVDYQTALENLFTELKTDIGAPNLKFFGNYLHFLGGGANATNKGKINTALENFVAVDPTKRSIISIDWSHLQDAYHFEARAQIAIGELAYEFFSDGYVAPTTSTDPEAAAPTDIRYMTSTRVLSFTKNPLYAANSDYEITYNGGLTYTTMSSSTVTIPNNDSYIPYQIGIRVKRASGRKESPTLYNLIPIEGVGSTKYEQSYGTEIDTKTFHTYHGVPSRFVKVGSASGVGYKIDNTLNADRAMDLRYAPNTGTEAYQLRILDGDAVCKKNGTAVYTETATSTWYRLLSDVNGNIKFQKSVTGAAPWTTMYTDPTTPSQIGSFYTKIVGNTIAAVTTYAELDYSDIHPNATAIYLFGDIPQDTNSWLSGCFYDTSGHGRHISNALAYNNEGKNWWFGNAGASSALDFNAGRVGAGGFTFIGKIRQEAAKYSTYLYKAGEYKLWYNSDTNEINFTVYTASDESTSVNVLKAMPLNEDHAVVARYDSGTNTVSLSLDGVSSPTTASATGVVGRNEKLTFSSANGTNAIAGKTWGFRFFDTHLDDSQITTILT